MLDNILLICYSSLTVVHVRVKRGRQVPVLSDNDAEKTIEDLMKCRQTIGVSKDNIYVFATPTRESKKPLRGNDCMFKSLSVVEDTQFPERIRSTELCKYCATVSQIADLGEGDL